MTKTQTRPAVFIIESLKMKNESVNKYGGKLIYDILNLSNIENQYYYLRTDKELKYILEIFRKLNYRYLLLCCHANEKNIGLTLDRYSFTEFGNIINPYITGKRLFLSSCLAVNDYFKKEVLQNSSCLSVIGPDFKIKFQEASLMWSSFFYILLSNEKRGMLNNEIDITLSKLFITFNRRMNGYKRMMDGSYQKMKFDNEELQIIRDKLTSIK